MPDAGSAGHVSLHVKAAGRAALCYVVFRSASHIMRDARYSLKGPLAAGYEAVCRAKLLAL